MRADRPSQRRAYLERLRRGNPGDQPERYAETDRASHGKPYYPDLARGRDVRVRWSQGAGFRDDEPLMQGLAIAVIIVFFFLLVNFKKIGLALAALSSLLLTLFGAALGLWAFHIDFSLTCVLGVISLIGIVVRNAILIFEHAQDLRLHKHYSPRDAAFDAAGDACSDLPDLGYNGRGRGSHDHQRQFLWMPMGVVICSGTVFSMILRSSSCLFSIGRYSGINE